MGWWDEEGDGKMMVLVFGRIRNMGRRGMGWCVWFRGLEGEIAKMVHSGRKEEARGVHFGYLKTIGKKVAGKSFLLPMYIENL